MKENDVILSDSVYPWGDTERKSFVSLSKEHYDVVAVSGFKDYINVSMFLDSEKDTYERVVFSFFDMFGMLGGVFEILKNL